jgi:hypothetical protein
LRSHVTAEFRRLFQKLPVEVRRRARERYLLWKENPAHPSVQFKRVHSRELIYSVRIGIDWRAWAFGGVSLSQRSMATAVILSWENQRLVKRFP